ARQRNDDGLSRRHDFDLSLDLHKLEGWQAFRQGVVLPQARMPRQFKERIALRLRAERRAAPDTSAETPSLRVVCVASHQQAQMQGPATGWKLETRGLVWRGGVRKVAVDQEIKRDHRLEGRSP